MITVWLIALYECKLILRQKLCWLLALGVITGIAVFQWDLQGNECASWVNAAIPCSIPLVNAWLFNVSQIFWVVWLGIDCCWRDKKCRANEVFSVRPFTNVTYLSGKVLGIAIVCLLLNLISILITLGIHLLAARGDNFQPLFYLFYFLTLTLPTLIFMLGFVIWLSLRVRLHFVLYLWMTLVFVLFYFVGDDGGYSLFDPWGRAVTTLFSDVTGMAHFELYVFHRSIYFLWGVGLLLLSIRNMKRLTEIGRMQKMIRWGGVFCLISGVLLGGGYLRFLIRDEIRRNLYLEVYDRYANKPLAHVISQDLYLQRTGDRIEVKGDLLLSNKSKKEISKPILYLNPGLQVEVLTSDGIPVKFIRDHQVIILERTLAAGDSLSLHIAYEGSIDNAVCYPEIPVERHRDSRIETNETLTRSVLREGNDYAVVGDEFTFLLPECLWYPSAFPPINVSSPLALNYDYTRFCLRVRPEKEEFVLSQGVMKREGKEVVFENERPLPKLSLCMGRYQKKEIRLNEVDIELYYFKNHDYWQKEFHPRKDEMVGMLERFFPSLGRSYQGGFPYRKLVIAEVPLTLRSYKRVGLQADEWVQPEILFLPERNFKGPYFPMKQIQKFYGDNWGVSLDKEYLSMNCFFNLSPMFKIYPGTIVSEKYIGIGNLLDGILQADNATAFISLMSASVEDQRATNYFKNRNLNDFFTDHTLPMKEMLFLLRKQFEQIRRDIYCRIPLNEFQHFVRDFMEKHRNESVDFRVFDTEFQQCFRLNLDSIIRPYYETRGLPRLFVKEMKVELVQGKRIGSCKVYNPSSRDGIVTVVGDVDFRTFRSSILYDYLIPARSCKEIRTPINFTNYVVNTNLSENIPWANILSFAHILLDSEDVRVGMWDADSNVFIQPPEGIIVDNEEVGFRIRQKEIRRRLGRGKKSDKEYEGMLFQGADQWTWLTSTDCYGVLVRSCCCKVAEGGDSEVEWKVEIPEAGRYEIQAYLPKIKTDASLVLFEKGTKLHYRLITKNREQKIVIYPGEEEPGWVSLGYYDLPKGECRLVLNDKGGTPLSQNEKVLGESYQYIVADAVRWLPIDK